MEEAENVCECEEDREREKKMHEYMKKEERKFAHVQLESEHAQVC